MKRIIFLLLVPLVMYGYSTNYVVMKDATVKLYSFPSFNSSFSLYKSKGGDFFKGELLEYNEINTNEGKRWFRVFVFGKNYWVVGDEVENMMEKPGGEFFYRILEKDSFYGEKNENVRRGRIFSILFPIEKIYIWGVLYANDYEFSFSLRFFEYQEKVFVEVLKYGMGNLETVANDLFFSHNWLYVFFDRTTLLIYNRKERKITNNYGGFLSIPYLRQGIIKIDSLLRNVEGIGNFVGYSQIHITNLDGRERSFIPLYLFETNRRVWDVVVYEHLSNTNVVRVTDESLVASLRPVRAVVTADVLRVRRIPKMKYYAGYNEEEIIERLKRGEEVVILRRRDEEMEIDGKRGRWVYVDTGRSIDEGRPMLGWVFDAYLRAVGR